MGSADARLGLYGLREAVLAGREEDAMIGFGGVGLVARRMVELVGHHVGQCDRQRPADSCSPIITNTSEFCKLCAEPCPAAISAWYEHPLRLQDLKCWTDEGI